MSESMGTASWQFQARQQASEMVHEAAAKLMPALDQAQKAKAQSIRPGLAYGRGVMGRR
jgi:hypothetical protein